VLFVATDPVDAEDRPPPRNGEGTTRSGVRHVMVNQVNLELDRSYSRARFVSVWRSVTCA